MNYFKWIWIIMVCIWGLAEKNVAFAQNAQYEETVIEAEGFGKISYLTDGKRDTYSKCENEGEVRLSRADRIGAIYIEFDRIPQPWTITDSKSGKTITCGENGFLHEYVDVAAAFGEEPEGLILSFEENTVLADVYGFSQGTLPEWVQMWKPPCEEADLLLVSSHSDDEQLFFAGILPYYAMERKLNVQVAYVIQHFEANNVANHQRPHEQLDGLWKVGVRNYPLMSGFPDLYAESKDKQQALSQAIAAFESAGFTYDDFVTYFIQCIRKCKPLVVVSHDFNGEYGHGTHVLCAAALTEAIEDAAEESKDPDSAKIYGTWMVEKTYFHLYEENPIVMDFDVPLESLGGKTAFQVSQEGFGCHKSQHWTWFYKWMYGTADKPITKASEITKYSPCLYGLYDSKVGMDRLGGDFFEHIQTYDERAKEKARIEEEERLAKEAEKAEEERLRLEEQKAQEVLEESHGKKEAEDAEAAAENKMVIGAVLAAVLLMSIFLLFVRKQRKNKDS